MSYLFRWLSYLGLCASVALLGVSFWYEVNLNSNLLPQVASNKELQTQSLKKYLNDSEWLSEHPFFSDKRIKNNNFQNFLYQIKMRHGENSLENHPVLHPLFLSTEVKSEVLKLDDNWIEKSHKLRNFEIDLSIFENIMDYDHWNYNEPEIAWDKPIDPFNIIISAKIFVLKSIHDNISAELILVKLRKLAYLLSSVDDVHFKISSLSALKIEAETYHFFNKRSPSMQLKDWKIVPPEEITRIRRTILATAGYLEPWTAPDILKSIFLSEKKAICFCADYKIKKNKLDMLKPLFENSFPFEISFSQSQTALKQIALKYAENCKVNFRSVPAANPELTYKIDRMPFFRRITGIKIAVRDMYHYQEYIF